MMDRTGGYTLGVEEEYQIVDPETRGLRPHDGSRVLLRAEQSLGEEVAPELLTSQIEAITPVCRTLSEVRAEVLRLRREVAEAAAGEGNKIVAASTHPFADWREQQVTPKERYEGIMGNYQRLARQQLAFGFHVHVGLEDRETTLRVMNRARNWLSPLLALSANSPFWQGADTGYASYRTQVWGRFPVSGPPGSFASLDEYDALVEALVAAGSIADATKVYWDLRLSEHAETLEFRVADVCSKVDETIALTGLSRGLVRSCRERAEHGKPYTDVRPELLEVAHWRASRDGLDSELVDVESGRAIPAREMIERLLAFTRPALEEAGDWEEVSTLVREVLRYGNGATRQRRAYERAGRLEDVVDSLIEETEEGIERSAE